MADSEWIYHGRRYWITEPKGDEQAGWNTDFVPCPVFKKTAKRVGILSPHLGILWLNREAFDRDGRVYHSKPHEWFYKVKPAVDPEKPRKGFRTVYIVPVAFAALGLKPGCTRDEIKRAYKRLSLKAHPDTPTGSHDAFIKLNKAYESALQIVG